jgi:hypothetical protein
MHTVVTRFDRPSKDIPFYLDTDPELKAKFNEFIEIHKELIVSMNVENSDTTQITYVTYSDKDMCDTFLYILNNTFPTLFTDRDAYCNANGIEVNRYVHDS